MSMAAPGRARLRLLVPILALVPSAWMMAACGKDRPQGEPAQQKVAAGAPAAAAPSFDPCALLTSAEVEAAVGWKVTATRPNGSGGYGTCTFTGRTDPMVVPPENLEVGLGRCPVNMYCTELPEFTTSEDLARYRRQGYEEAKGGAFDMKPNIVALTDFGVPAIDHELAGRRSIEMAVGHQRLAFVITWSESEPARALARKALARVH